MIHLDQLWALADDLAASARTTDELFGECGLFLVRPLVREEYFCTPLNTLTFASTGGDGVHYGFLQLSDVPSEQLPVVMTVPMSDRQNTVVAESLTEFLGLGYHVGWFALEQLAYDASDAVNYFSQPDTDSWPEKDQELRVIREGLPITYTALSLTRIESLNNKYLPLVMLPESKPPGS